MLDEETLDAVHITTPHYLHAPMTLSALKRDIYVFLEKPMCITREEISTLIEAEKKSRASVTVSFQTRYSKANVIAKKSLKRTESSAHTYLCFGNALTNTIPKAVGAVHTLQKAAA